MRVTFDREVVEAAEEAWIKHETAWDYSQFFADFFAKEANRQIEQQSIYSFWREGFVYITRNKARLVKITSIDDKIRGVFTDRQISDTWELSGRYHDDGHISPLDILPIFIVET